ncbi:MAG: 3-phosphoserine/phosphohydroxythreonine transaminase [Clostridia bacterium]|nr:3-phosphoserine/phosphohydroxythreonine transaminase [Clostridia bacterium]MBQ2737834.1 3-phosphoserine/phosphohydroxythreonine transaminase [Clostridia bacterium]MBQ8289702.1 3-phosphoserine/phosphohydroxythreonine transaminase [Clostridia bacterium]
MERVYNFSAGPSMLPLEVLEQAQKDLICYGESGMSVMEMSHRSYDFEEILHSAEESLRKVMDIPQNYKVLFLQGGASTQFAAVPLNLLSEHKCADYIVSGQFSKKAATEAKKYGDIAIAASSAGATPTFSTIPETTKADFRPDADYVHICFNNTIYGTKFHYIPDTGNIPLVADISSCIISEPIDVSKFGMLYAGAQKNVAPAGLTIVIIREDLVGNARPDTPAMLDYKNMVENDSMYNTPPCWCIYMAKLVFDWILSIGGLEEMKRRNERKASILYDYLDGQDYYTAPVDKKCRSMMNVVFVTGDADLDKKFATEAAKAGLKNLKGHRSVGGMRASIYNAMPEEGVVKLVEFMKKFAMENPKL